MTLTELQRAAMNQIDSGYKKIKRLMADPKISTEAVIITLELPVHFEDTPADAPVIGTNFEGHTTYDYDTTLLHKLVAEKIERYMEEREPTR